MVWNPEDYDNITLLPVPVAEVNSYLFLYIKRKIIKKNERKTLI